VVLGACAAGISSTLGTAGEGAGGHASAAGAAAPTGLPAAVGRPVSPVLRTVDLVGTGRHRATALAPRTTRPFSLVGVTWTDRRTRLEAVVTVRTRSAGSGSWRPWTALSDEDDHEGDGGAARGGTEPLWVGPSDGIQLRVDGRSSTSLPAGLRLDLIDPGATAAATGTGRSEARPTTDRIAPAAYTAAGLTTSGSTTVPPTVSTTVSTAVTLPTPSGATATAIGTTPTGTTHPATGATSAGTAGTGTTAALIPPATVTTSSTTSSSQTSPSAGPAPSTAPTRTLSPLPGGGTSGYVSRAGWGADESLRRAGPQYATSARVLFVHHTTSSNTYSCSDSAALVRGLYAYHVLSQGWNDIGYNALVDRCGTLFEGRHGGLDRPVIGAHTYGFNTGSSSIAVIGTFNSPGAAPEVIATLARFAAWKLRAAAASTASTSVLVEGASNSHGFTGGRSYRFAVISGHRDGYATECPGSALYAQLPAVRTLAAQAAAASALVVSVSPATPLDGRFYVRGPVTVRWSTELPASTLAGFAVLVDGRIVATTGADRRTADVTLPTGSHTIAVRATYVPEPTPAPTPTGPEPSATLATSGTPDSGDSGSSGSSGTGAVTATPTTATTSTPSAPAPTEITTTVRVIYDLTAPVFAAGPTLGLRGGTVNATGTPVVLSWRATDDSRLLRVTATAPARATFTPATRTWNTVAGPGLRTYSLTAADGAGNVRTAATSGATAAQSETAATPVGRWTTLRSESYVGGAALSATAKNASLSWTFTGRSVAWVATRTQWSGQAVVYLDGAKVATVDLKGPYTSYRQAVWVRNGLRTGRHTVKALVVGTSGRPTVISDGIVSLS
jgi:uncharacterized protein with LGFP repeats